MKQIWAAGGLVLGLTLLGAPTEAQTGGVRGKVVDAEGRPVADAKIVIEGRGGVSRKYETTTNDKGEYARIGVLHGPYRIAAFKEGYQAVALERNVHMGEPVEIPDLRLEVLGRDSTVAEDAAAELRKKYAAAAELTRAGQLDEAEALFEEILKVLPGLGAVHQNLGYICAERQDWAKAEEHYLEAVALSPDEPTVKHGLIKVYRRSGQSDKALELATQMAEENPQDAAAQFNLGLFLSEAKRTDEAAEAFEAALVADPELSEAHFELGRILILSNAAPEALQHLDAYLAGNPTNAQNKATAEGLVEALKK